MPNFSENLRKSFASQLERQRHALEPARMALAASEEQAAGWSKPEREVARQKVKQLQAKLSELQSLRQPMPLGQLYRARRRTEMAAWIIWYHPHVLRLRLINFMLRLWLNLLITLITVHQLWQQIASKEQIQNGQGKSDSAGETEQDGTERGG